MEHHGRRALSLSVDLGQQQLTSGALGEMQTHGRSPGPRSQSLHCTRLQAIRSHISAWESLVLKSSPSFIVPDSTINSPAPCTSIDHPFGEALQGLLDGRGGLEVFRCSSKAFCRDKWLQATLFILFPSL